MPDSYSIDWQPVTIATAAGRAVAAKAIMTPLEDGGTKVAWSRPSGAAVGDLLTVRWVDGRLLSVRVTSVQPPMGDAGRVVGA